MSVTASPYWVNSAPQKLAAAATTEIAARRAIWSPVNGTGGSSIVRPGGSGGGAPSTAAVTRAAA